ncbi:hypothetical protein [Streptomyces violaceus]|uniref:Uncharacterized protein n=1 Tax=Streptomyces violaceus TaxID=1936 RepID=A0ABY9U9J7_STRVL|nr:hypothetical protein [Streptomyces janthinus]WND18495.1 hypothetical protein RI060_14630 [Streptomyces janthinus]GGS82110.1 hypothetical protein GCM10010270_62800 [Streptomyces janthinus]
MLEWLWREDCFAPWALDLAMRYIDRNVAVAESARLLTEARRPARSGGLQQMVGLALLDVPDERTEGITGK